MPAAEQRPFGFAGAGIVRSSPGEFNPLPFWEAKVEGNNRELYISSLRMPKLQCRSLHQIALAETHQQLPCDIRCFVDVAPLIL